MSGTGKFSTTLNASLRNLAGTGRGKKQAISVAVDALLVVFALWLAFSVRRAQVFVDFQDAWHAFLILPLITTALFAAMGVYRWQVRSTNRRLFQQLLKGCVLSALALLVVYFVFPDRTAGSRLLIALYGCIVLAGTTGARMCWQRLFDLTGNGEPVAVYGAGRAGRQLIEMLDIGSVYRPVILLDDDPSLIRTMVAGVRVIDGHDPRLGTVLRSLDVTKVILAIPTISNKVYQEKLDQLAALDISVLTIPDEADIVSGRAVVEDVRSVSVQDILGRSEVVPNRELMHRRVAGKSVLVTGGGGSIGSELCRQILTLAPQKLVVLENCEANLYHLTEELCSLLKGTDSISFVPMLGSVRDRAEVDWVMKEHDIDTIYHAAAYKHVPIVEGQPDQGLAVNVFGTMTVLDSAIEHGVDDFVLISTDKAVRPSNAMGASKRVAELVLQAKARSTTGTRISMVRFGNVLGSSGSVVPKFEKQILAGGPVTLTHSEVTRFFMTIPEAAQLVLQASALARGGDVFVLDMGEPVKILDLARTMVRLYGKQLQSETGDENDIEIVELGLRAGEKMYEEMFIADSFRKTEVARIFTAQERWLPWNILSEYLDELQVAATNHNQAAVKRKLLALAHGDSTLIPFREEAGGKQEREQKSSIRSLRERHVLKEAVSENTRRAESVAV